MTAPVALHRLARRAAAFSFVHLPVGAIVVLEDGTRWRVQPRGELDRVVEGGRPHGGIGEDPSAGRAP